MYPGYGSGVEAGNPTAATNQFDAFTDKAIRMAFIRKVYGIVSVQLLITLVFVILFSTSTGAKAFAAQNIWLFFVALAGTFISLISLACCGLHRTYPANLVCLGIFTFAESLMIGFSTCFRRGEIVLYAVIITAVIVLALTIFAFQTKIDFTAFNGILFVCLIIFMLFGLLTIFIKGKIMMLIYSSVGALLFSAYLIMDTQLIVGGNHKSQFSPEDYILAAITIYTDIINIFIYILQILDLAGSD